MSCLELAHRNGHWVILNNIHLMPSWLIELEKKLDEFALEGSHEKFRLYLSSDPSNAIPIGVLSRCIKLTNEPPAGLKANLKRAFANFSREYIEEVNEPILPFGVGACTGTYCKPQKCTPKYSVVGYFATIFVTDDIGVYD